LFIDGGRRRCGEPVRHHVLPACQQRVQSRCVL